MTCTSPVPGVVVCWSDRSNDRKRYVRCWTCECVTEMVVRVEFWHGTSWYCCRCGDSWSDEGRFPRPFQREWRKAAVARHRRMWDRASHGPHRSHEDMSAEFYGEPADYSDDHTVDRFRDIETRDSDAEAERGQQ